MRADAIPVCLQLGRERRPVRGAHRRGEPRPPRLVGRQLVRLLVVPLLQPVLDATQIAVRSVELLDCRGGQQLLAREQRQRAKQTARLEARVASAADQLERLHDELDLADTARAKLDVVLELASLDFAGDQLLHPAQRLEHAEVEIAAIDERAQHVAIQLIEAHRARDRPRLDIGVALPVASVLLQVVLERPEADHERTRLAERPQPQIHAIDKALVRHRAEKLRYATSRAG